MIRIAQCFSLKHRLSIERDSFSKKTFKMPWEKKCVIARMNQAELGLLNFRQSWKRTALNYILLRKNYVQNRQSSISTFRFLQQILKSCLTGLMTKYAGITIYWQNKQSIKFFNLIELLHRQTPPKMSWWVILGGYVLYMIPYSEF